MPCAGQPSELCGGGNLINIYENTVIATTTRPGGPSATPTVVPAVGNFRDQGCYVDSIDSRILRGDSIANDPAMSVAKCAEFARKGGWRYAGVQYGIECFVGNTLRGNERVSSSECNLPCSGDAGQLCGQGNRMQVYADGTWYSPIAAELAAALKDYSKAIEDVKEAIKTYESHIKKLKALQGRRSSKRQSPTEVIYMQVMGDQEALETAQWYLGMLAAVGGSPLNR